jgi:hypothetical protein
MRHPWTPRTPSRAPTDLREEPLVEGNYLHGNGVVGQYLEHDAYTEALGIVYQYNHFGPLRAGALGAALKDRSAGTVVRYNWIDGTIRPIDLVDAQDDVADAIADPRYRQTFVYGNVIVSNPGDGTRLVHYGGDSQEQYFRKGTLFFYGNTVYMQHDIKDAWVTSVIYASTNDEHVDFRDNVIHLAGTSHLALLADAGTMDLGSNWITTGWQNGTDSFTGTVTGAANVKTGTNPMLDLQTLHPQAGSPVIGAAGSLAQETASYPVVFQYAGLQGQPRAQLGPSGDLGAFAASP